MKTLCVGLSVFALACGGSLQSDDVLLGDGGTNNDGTTGDSAKDAPPPPPNGCPTSPPAGGASCSSAQDQLRCEYGNNPDPDCNQMFFCNQGTWQDESSGTICPPQSDCPAAYSDIPANQNCSPNGLQCAYPQGECICTTSFGGLQKQMPAWDCIPATSGCPSPRPDIGSPCSSVNEIQCDYGACSGGVALECKNGVWMQVITPCPG